MKREYATLVLGCLFFIHSGTLLAEDNDTSLSLSMGTEFTSGTYGGTIDIEDTYIPVTATTRYGTFVYRLTIPYLSVKAPAGTVISGPDGEPLPGTGDVSTESGLGDAIGSVTFLDVLKDSHLGLAVDLTAKVKFATADENKGLGTGENDYTLQADLFRFAERLTMLASVGYTFRGDPAGIELDDVMSAALGVVYEPSAGTRGGVIFDYRDSSISSRDSVQELTGFLSRRFSEHWQLQLFALAGFTDSSLDWGGGFQLKRIL